MKLPTQISRLMSIGCACLFALMALVTLSVDGQTNAPSANAKAVTEAEAAFPKSEFIDQGGRDPFYPNRVVNPIKLAPTLKESDAGRYLVLNGLLGTVGKPLASINGRPFEAGEMGEVGTIVGKLQIKCLEIRQDSVVVQIVSSGERKELSLRGK